MRTVSLNQSIGISLFIVLGPNVYLSFIKEFSLTYASGTDFGLFDRYVCIGLFSPAGRKVMQVYYSKVPPKNPQ